MNKNKSVTVDRSGSCAIVVFIIDEAIYILNTGDSRAVCSKANGA